MNAEQHSSESGTTRGYLLRLAKGSSVLFENKKVLLGLSIFLGVYLISEIGYRFSVHHPTRYGDVPMNLSPSWEHPLGTDPMGRDLLTQLLYGTRLSMHIGIMAGVIAFSVSVLVAFIGGYCGGFIDSIFGVITEVFLTIPSLAILILIAAIVPKVTIAIMATILAIFSWAWPAKVMRSQVLSLKERGFVRLAKLSGYSGIEIIIREIVPNMLPFLGAYFAVVVNAAMLAEAGLEIIGLGPQHTITLGIMLNWAMVHSAVTRGLTWWWLPPSIMLILIFLGLFVISMGLDEIANPRLEMQG